MCVFSRKIGIPILGILVLCCVTFSSNIGAQEWQVEKHYGRDYVSAKSVAQFYRTQLKQKGKNWEFAHPRLTMVWVEHSNIMYVNSIKFNLSFPVLKVNGQALLSTVDLAKLIDPIIRPEYIKKPILFDTVVIDPGHGGHDSGAKSLKGKFEKDYNLDLSLRLRSELLKRGFRIVMTRDTDVFLQLGQRVEIANAQKKAIFISIHHNSSSARSANGIETFALTPQGTAPTNSRSRYGWSNALSGNARDSENIALATAVHAHVITHLKPVDRGVKRDRFKVLTGINKPAILYEGGFLTNWSDFSKIDNDSFRQTSAEIIANAIVKFRDAVGRKK